MLIGSIQELDNKPSYLQFEPGNGTRYDMYFIPQVRQGIWVVAVPNFNVSIEIADYATVDWTYVLEKFSRKGKENFNECDASAMAEVIAKVLGCPYRVHTGSDGRWIETTREGKYPEAVK